MTGPYTTISVELWNRLQDRLAKLEKVKEAAKAYLHCMTGSEPCEESHSGELAEALAALREDDNETA